MQLLAAPGGLRPSARIGLASGRGRRSIAVLVSRSSPCFCNPHRRWAGVTLAPPTSAGSCCQGRWPQRHRPAGAERPGDAEKGGFGGLQGLGHQWRLGAVRASWRMHMDGPLAWLTMRHCCCAGPGDVPQHAGHAGAEHAVAAAGAWAAWGLPLVCRVACRVMP